MCVCDAYVRCIFPLSSVGTLHAHKGISDNYTGQQKETEHPTRRQFAPVRKWESNCGAGFFLSVMSVLSSINKLTETMHSKDSGVLAKWF